MEKTLYVIVRVTGEYSDRDEEPIAYTWSEEDAQAAVDRAAIEAQALVGIRPPYPERAKSHDWVLPDGTICETFVSGAKYVRRENADEIDAENEREIERYYAACRALGCVDPRGPQADASYYFTAVQPLAPPRA